MRPLLSIARLAVAVVLLFAAAPAMAGTPHYEVRVDGLACPFCAYGLEKKLKDLPGVRNVTVDLEGAVASFDVAREHTLLPGPVQEAVREAGFTAREITVHATGTVARSGDAPTLDVGHEQSLQLRDGEAFDQLEALLEQGQGEVAVTGPVTRSGSAWALRVDSVEGREEP